MQRGWVTSDYFPKKHPTIMLFSGGNLIYLEQIFRFLKNFDFDTCCVHKKVRKLPKMTYYHQQYIPNKTSNNFDIWYTGLNLYSVEKFFSFLFILIFSVLWGQKGQKLTQIYLKCKKNCVNSDYLSTKHSIIMICFEKC